MKQIEKCRVCLSEHLFEIGSLGNIAISDFTEKPEKGNKFPLTLTFCTECRLPQLAHNIPRELLYDKYWYESHINPIIVNDLKEIAAYTKGKSNHIDIGGNDGTLLKYSQAKNKISVDPSNIDPGWSEEIDWVQDYWENVQHLYTSSMQADIITAIACLYDLPNPNAFMQNVKKFLTEDGVFIAQLMTLQPMIENNDLGNICHEHIEYYSYKSLVTLFEKNGLEIFKVETNTINGGSYRLFARHFKKESVLFQEKEYTIQDLRNFFERIENSKKKVLEFLKTVDNMKVYGYGASTKANTLLQYYNITGRDMNSIVEINPEKFGKLTIATNIPIISHMPQDAEYLWVFPYGFIDYFKEKEKGYTGKWLTTIPEFYVTG